MNDIFKDKLKKYKVIDKYLYLIVSIDKYEDDAILLDKIAAALAGGVDIIELSTNNNSKRLLTIAEKVKQLSDIFNFTLIIKDRLDVAYFIEADGVSLLSTSIDPNFARQLLGENILIASYDLSYGDCDFYLSNTSVENLNVPLFLIDNNPTHQTKIAVSNLILDAESPKSVATMLKKSLLD